MSERDLEALAGSHLCKIPPRFDSIGLSDSAQILLLREMLRIRVFEETVADLVIQKQIVTPCHLYTGQEAVAVGICHSLRDEDQVFSTHRSHGHYLAKGGGMQEAMAELFCRVTGCSFGRGGSMHLAFPTKGLPGSSSIVSGSMSIAVGAALAEAVRKSGGVSVVFHGDGVPEEGSWHESANFSAVRKLPIVFVCENNLYCTHMPLPKRRVHDNFPEMAKAHGFRYIAQVDGNDVLALAEAGKLAIEKARNGEGPAFIECRTYRWRGHVGPNFDVDMGIRSQEEIDFWKTRCPVETFSRYLLQKGVLSETAWKQIQSEVSTEVDASVEFAKMSPYPDVSSLTNHVFREGK